MPPHNKDKTRRAAIFYRSAFASLSVLGLISAEIGDRAIDVKLGKNPEEMLARCQEKFEGLPKAWPVCVADHKRSFERATFAHQALRIVSGGGLLLSLGFLAAALRRREEEDDNAPDAPAP